MPTLEWNVSDYLRKIEPHSFCNMKSKNRIKITDIEYCDVLDAYSLAAIILTEHGSKYLPVFKRLHQELSKYKAENELLKTAKNVALLNSSPDFKNSKFPEKLSHIFSHISHTK